MQVCCQAKHFAPAPCRAARLLSAPEFTQKRISLHIGRCNTTRRRSCNGAATQLRNSCPSLGARPTPPHHGLCTTKVRRLLLNSITDRAATPMVRPPCPVPTRSPVFEVSTCRRCMPGKRRLRHGAATARMLITPEHGVLNFAKVNISAIV